jgi:hypothetical protein
MPRMCLQAYFQPRAAAAARGSREEQAIVDYVTVIESRPGIAADQDLHSDTSEAGMINMTTPLKRGRPDIDDEFVTPFSRHLEMHVMLQPVTSLMGPTRFCPCTHGHYWSPAMEQRVVYRRFGLDGLCDEQDGKTSYEGTTTRAGDVTLYDAALFHRGTANKAEVARSLVSISYAASLGDASSRGYMRWAEAKMPVAHTQGAKFRTPAWRADL